MTGPMTLHGPHHSAQKSTNTGTGDFRTSCSKFSFVMITSAIAFISFSEYFVIVRLGCGVVNAARLQKNDQFCIIAKQFRYELFRTLQRGVEQLAARKAHNLEVGGSSPPPATNLRQGFAWFTPRRFIEGWFIK